MNREFVLVASGAYVKFDTLSALDAAFDAACERNPVGVQITAETYRTVSGQGIGRTHAYRLVDGRVFRRSLDNWQDAELAEVSHVERPYHAIKDDPRLLIPAAAGMLRADKVWTKDGWRKAPAPMPGVHEADRRRGPVSWLHHSARRCLERSYRARCAEYETETLTPSVPESVAVAMADDPEVPDCVTAAWESKPESHACWHRDCPEPEGKP